MAPKQSHGDFQPPIKHGFPCPEYLVAALTRLKLRGLYQEFSAFLHWRKQPALMLANQISELSGEGHHIIFDRISEQQIIRCSFDFLSLTASFEEV